MNLENKRVRIDVRWASSNKPHVWDLYHYFVKWCDTFSKMGGFNELTICKDFCSYSILMRREWDYSKDLIIICNNYYYKEFRKLQILIRKHFKKYKPQFQKPKLF